MKNLSDPRPVGRSLLGLFLAVSSLYALTAGGHLYGRDEVGLFHMTDSFVREGRFSVPRTINTQGGAIGRDGRYYTPFGIGQPLLASPLLVLGELVFDDRDEPYLRVLVLVLFGILISAGNAVVLAELLLFLGAGLRRAIGLALIFALCTLSWAYAHTYFTEPLTTMLGLLTVRSLLHWQQRGEERVLLLAAVIAGFSVLVRFFTVLLLPLYGLFVLLAPASGAAPAGISGRPRIRAAILFALVSGLLVVLVLARNQMLYGWPLASGYVRLPTGEPRGFTHPILPGLAILLLSPGKSLFLFAPPVILGLLALPGWGSRRPAAALLVAGSAAIYLVGYAHWCRPEGGFTWGPRFLLPIVPLLFLPLATGRFSRSRRAVLLALAALGLAVASLAWSVDFAQRIRVRYEEYYRPDGSYEFWFAPFADHYREALRTAGQISPTPETIGRNRRHLVPDWAGEPDLWFVHLIREGHTTGLVAFLLLLVLFPGVIGARWLLPLRARSRC